MSVLLLLQLRCRWCELVFYICRCCFRGQAYCCGECRIAGQRQNHREAQRKYRQTEKGKKAHRQAENRRRYDLSQKSQKNMDDASSTVLQGWCMKLAKAVGNRFLYVNKPPRCHFCGSYGQIVEAFPRRGYG